MPEPHPTNEQLAEAQRQIAARDVLIDRLLIAVADLRAELTCVEFGVAMRKTTQPGIDGLKFELCTRGTYENVRAQALTWLRGEAP